MAEKTDREQLADLDLAIEQKRDEIDRLKRERFDLTVARFKLMGRMFRARQETDSPTVIETPDARRP